MPMPLNGELDPSGGESEQSLEVPVIGERKDETDAFLHSLGLTRRSWWEPYAVVALLIAAVLSWYIG